MAGWCIYTIINTKTHEKLQTTRPAANRTAGTTRKTKRPKTKMRAILLTYLILCAVSYVFGQSNPYWDSAYFIREHGFIIVLSYLLYDKIKSSFEGLLLTGLIVYKCELIIYNIALLFTTSKILNTVYDSTMILTISLFFIIFVTRYLDKILVTFNRFLRWIKQ